MVIKIIELGEKYNIIERNNKTRKGLYYQAKYTDSTGKVRIIERKKYLITKTQFEDNLNKVKGLKTSKEKRNLSNSYITSKEVRLRSKKELIPAEEKVKTEKDYNLERELSKNKLINDRKAIKKPSVYENEEAVIIMRVGSKGSLSDMSEASFRAKLYSYMNITGEPKGNKALFIEDIVNKWGVEFKQ
jgi:hypothetical protein